MQHLSQRRARTSRAFPLRAGAELALSLPLLLVGCSAETCGQSTGEGCVAPADMPALPGGAGAAGIVGGAGGSATLPETAGSAGVGGSTSSDPGSTTPGQPDGTAPPDGQAGAAGAPAGGATGDPPGVTEPTGPVWINEQGKVVAASNAFGIQGDWYAFGDGVTSSQSGNPYRDGMYCITGEAPGDEDHAAHWGAGLGLDLNGVSGEKLPFEYEGKITGFRIRLVGEAPAPARVHFVSNLENDVTPFIPATLGESFVYSIADAQVPLEWGVDNAGERVDAGVLYSLQIMVPGADAAGPIDLCIAEFEPVYDPEGMGSSGADGAYVNRDGFILAENNEFGIQGPVYAIGDGVSTTQSGNPYTNGKYCVSGEFSGAADAWGAGVAFDLNKAPGGGPREPFTHAGEVAGFRLALSGQTPGPARVQFIINEPQEGSQPFLVAQLNTTAHYPIDWAQVPTSWDVDGSGMEVGASLYTVQLYLDGSEAGPFEVCVEEFEPLAAADLPRTAQPAGTGYHGVQTIDAQRLESEYQRWKSRHFSDCGDGTACVPRDEGDCISEGIGYGMLLGVGHDDQEAFDKLWAYFKAHRNGAGLMSWQTSECGGTLDQGAATDGDLDAAMALIQAGCRWGGSYESEARELIGALKNAALENCNGRSILAPGDAFGGCNAAERHTNPSYFATGYYKVFAALTGDSAWTNLASDSYALLAEHQPRKDGLVSDWTDPTGTVPGGNYGEYGPDASRTPWRIATDYAWFGDERAVAFLDGVSAHIDENGGIPRLFTPNSNYRGGLAMSGLHQAAVKAQEYTDAWLTTSVDDNSYFPGTLRPVYMLLMANRFPAGCE